jgi:hypothetical protein
MYKLETSKLNVQNSAYDQGHRPIHEIKVRKLNCDAISASVFHKRSTFERLPFGTKQLTLINNFGDWRYIALSIGFVIPENAGLRHHLTPEMAEPLKYRVSTK